MADRSIPEKKVGEMQAFRYVLPHYQVLGQIIINASQN